MSGVEGSTLPRSHHHRLQFLPQTHHFRPNIFCHPACSGAPPAAEDRINQASKAQCLNGEGAEEVNDKGLIEAIDNHALPSTPCPPGKRYRKPKCSKNKISAPETPDLNGLSSNGLISANSCRYDSSLGLLTKKFINLLQKAEDGTLDLNRAADILQVQKRRIYDITNVLEGVGLIEKNLKNKIRLTGLHMSRPRELDDHISDLRAELVRLNKEELRVDELIRKSQEDLNYLTHDINNQKLLYITKEDICSLPSFKDDTLIAIKAPHGTSVEVPDPDEGIEFPQRQYEIFVRSTLGPIDCYLISKHEETPEAINHDRSPGTMNLSPNDMISVGKDGRAQSHQRDHLVDTTSEAEEPGFRMFSDFLNSKTSTGGLMKIAPSDLDMNADYWLLSDPAICMTEMWAAE